MQTAVTFPSQEHLPDHKELPDRDGAIVENFHELPQNLILTTSLEPRITERFGERFCIGSDCGIYYRATKPPLDGCKAPDWFLVPNVPPMLDGELRRSYVLWKEMIKPLLVIEYVSGDGSEEHDTTPYEGKFWVYEQAINAWYYVIYDRATPSLEVYHLTTPSKYQQMNPNAAGRYFIEPLGIELGLWEGKCLGIELPWLRAWDAATGKLMPTADEWGKEAGTLIDDNRRMRDEETERAEKERKRADKERERAEKERGRANEAEDRARKLAEMLRKAGIDPDAG